MITRHRFLKINILFLCVSLATTVLGMQERWGAREKLSVAANSVESAQQLYLSDEQDWCMVHLQEPVKPMHVKKDPLLVQAENLQKAVEQAQAVFAQEKDMFFVMMRRTSPNFCAEVVEALINNFQGTGIDHTKVYKYIGLTLLRAKNMTHTRVLKYLSSKYSARQLTDRQYRQLAYPFRTAESKIEYDMFCQGRLAELKLSEQAAQLMLQKFGKITGFGLKLADLEAFTRQLPEQLH
jgi:hypothetical protein